MAITTTDGLIAALGAAPRQSYTKASITTVAGIQFSLWKVAGQPGAGSDPGNTTTGVIPTDATAGSFPFTNPSGDSYIGRIASAGGGLGSLIVYDRLWHGGAYTSVNGTISSSTTTAIDRYTTGSGCELWAEVASALSATSTTITVTYVNQDGTGSRTATATLPSSAILHRVAKFDLQAGDTGIRQITDIAGSAAPTGTFNLVIAKILCEIPLALVGLYNVLDAFGAGMPEVVDNACIGLHFLANGTSSGTQTGTFSLIQG